MVAVVLSCFVHTAKIRVWYTPQIRICWSRLLVLWSNGVPAKVGDCHLVFLAGSFCKEQRLFELLLKEKLPHIEG